MPQATPARVRDVIRSPRNVAATSPRVRSAVVRMVPLAGTAGIDRALLGEIVTVAFSQRRKLLRHTLGRWLDARGAAPPFDVQRRAEEVSVGEYLGLAAAVGQGSPAAPRSG